MFPTTLFQKTSSFWFLGNAKTLLISNPTDLGLVFDIPNKRIKKSSSSIFNLLSHWRKQWFLGGDPNAEKLCLRRAFFKASYVFLLFEQPAKLLFIENKQGEKWQKMDEISCATLFSAKDPSAFDLMLCILHAPYLQLRHLICESEQGYLSRSFSFTFMAIPHKPRAQNKLALLSTEGTYVAAPHWPTIQKIVETTPLWAPANAVYPALSVYSLVHKITYHSTPLSAAVKCCTTLRSARNYSLTQLLIFMVILAVLLLQVIWLYSQMPGRAHPSKRQAYYETAASSPLCPE